MYSDYSVIIKYLINPPPRKYSGALILVQVGLIDLQDPSQTQTVGIHQAMPCLGPNGPLDLGFIPEAATPFSTPGASYLLKGEPGAKENLITDECWPIWSLMKSE